jgi:hypothetical protein
MGIWIMNPEAASFRPVWQTSPDPEPIGSDSDDFFWNREAGDVTEGPSPAPNRSEQVAMLANIFPELNYARSVVGFFIVYSEG